MKPWKLNLCRLSGALIAAAAISLPAAAQELSFYYPVAVGGPVTKIIDEMAADFEKENPGIKIKPVYAGSYQDTVTKVLTAAKGGDAPHIAVMLSTDMYTLIDEGVVVAIDDLLKAPEDKAWLNSFYPGFMQNSQTGGKTWGIPFQRSTVVMYWNKDLFKKAGLDPETPPKTWAEEIAFAKHIKEVLHTYELRCSILGRNDSYDQFLWPTLFIDIGSRRGSYP